MVKFPLKFFYNIGVILENLEFPHFCQDFLQKSFIILTPGQKTTYPKLQLGHYSPGSSSILIVAPVETARVLLTAMYR